MNSEREIRVSKYLSKHLRHEPERIGLTLEPGGWVNINDLLAACSRDRFRITQEELDLVVSNNSKKRFAYDETGTKIRAQQGHSVEIDLQLAPANPPDLLYHGTASRFLDSILRDGLRKMNRHHVHLSLDQETARNVGARHGKPVILKVDAAAMKRADFAFHVSGNNVWLVDSVPPQYLQVLS